MAIAIARQGMATLSSTYSSFRSSTNRIGMSASPAVASIGRILAPCSLLSVDERGYVSVSGRRGNRGGEIDETSHGGCFDDALAVLGRAAVLPKLVVLDLDFTVWPFYCWIYQNWELLPDLSFSADSLQSDFTAFLTNECCHFLPSSPREAVGDIDKMLLSAAHYWDASLGRIAELGAPPIVYPQAVDIIKALAAHEVEMAVASRTPSASVAKGLLQKLSITQHFSNMEIYFTIYSKHKHFTALQEKTGIPYSSMLFFDDEPKNINAAAKLGVSSILVTEGLDLISLEKGLNFFTSRNAQR